MLSSIHYFLGWLYREGGLLNLLGQREGLLGKIMVFLIVDYMRWWLTSIVISAFLKIWGMVDTKPHLCYDTTVRARDAGKKVGQGGRQEQKGTYYLRPTNISQKWRASEALFGEYHGLCLSRSYKWLSFPIKYCLLLVYMISVVSY